MQEFGQFEVLREVATEESAVVYLAQKKGGPQNKLFAIKLVSSPKGSEPSEKGELSAGAAEPFQKEILKAITCQKTAAARAPRHIAPVVDCGADARGVWYVTDYYPQGTLRKRISLGLGITAAELQYVVESLLEGLVAFRRRCGRSHGNLNAGNIFLSGEPGNPLQRTLLLLDRPCRDSEVHDGQFELDDIGALGQIIYQLVCHPEIGAVSEIVFPIFRSESWDKLGRDGEYWRELCNELLDPALSLRTLTLSKLAAQLRAKRLGVGRVLTGAVLVLLCAVGLFAWRGGRTDSREAEAVINTDVDLAGSRKTVQTAPPVPEISKKMLANHVAVTNRHSNEPLIPHRAIPQDAPPPSSQPRLFSQNALLSKSTNAMAAVIKATNTPPTIASVRNQTTEADKPFELPFLVTDKETPPSDLQVDCRSLSPAFLPQASLKVQGSGRNRALVIDPPPSKPGVAEIALVANDGALKVTNSFVLTVRPMNTPPIISRIGDQITEQNKPIELGLMLKDKETASEKLRVTKRSSNPSLIPESNVELTIRGTNGQVRITPANGQTGESRIRLTLSDGNAETSADFLVQVNPANTPPTISDIEDQITEPDQTIELTFAVGDKETPARDLLVTKISSDPALVPERKILVGRSEATGVLRITPTVHQSGTARITLVVSDGALRATNSFLLTVKAANTPPRISTIADQIMEQSGPLEPIAFRVTDKETEADNLEVVGESLTPALVPASSLKIRGTGPDRVLVVDPPPSQPGEAKLALIANDGAMKATNTFLLTVQAMNTPPLISGIQDQTIEQDGSIELVFSLEDKETAPEKLRVTKQSSNDSLIPEPNVELAVRGTNGRVRITPASGQIGESTIRLTVSDGKAETSTDFVVQVSPANTPPMISALEDQTTEQDKTIELTFSVGDKETAARDLLVTKISSDPSLVPERNILIGRSGAAGALRITPAADQSGTSRITLVVSDGALRATNSFLLMVKAANTPPRISTIADLSTEQNEPIGPVAFRVTDKETEADNLEVVGESRTPALVPASSLKIRGTGPDRVLVVDPPPTQPGEAKLALVANDGAMKVTNTFLLTVRPMNTPPLISRIKDQTIEQDRSIEFAFSLKDKETVTEKLRVTMRSSNPSLIPDSNIELAVRGTNGRMRITPASGQTGESRIGLAVSDGKLETKMDFMVLVKPANTPPSISWIGDQTTDQDKPIELAFSLQDKETAPEKLKVARNSSNRDLIPESHIRLEVSGTNGLIRIIPAVDQTGSARIKLTVSDGAADASTEFSLQVIPRNTPPVISELADRTTEESKMIEFSFAVSDKETPPRGLSIIKSSSNPLLVPEDNMVLSGSGKHRTLKVTPADSQTGTAGITLRVDDGSMQVTRSFQLEVRPRRQSTVALTMTNSIGMEFVKLGPYWIGKYEVTRADYEKLSPLDSFGLRGKQEPVKTTWNDAITFCGQLTFEEDGAKSVLGKRWIYSLLTTNEWQAVMFEEDFASLGIRRKAETNHRTSAREWSFSADDNLHAPAPVIELILEGDKIRIGEFAEDEKDAVHTFRCVLVQREELLASQESSAQPQKRRQRQASKMSGWQELLRNKIQRKF